METIRFTIPQAAIGAPRMTRADVWKRRPCVLAYRAWCDLIRDCCPNPPKAEETELVRVDAYYKPPESWSARKRMAAIGKRKRTKPDGDNIFKGVADALWKQDAALGESRAARWWAETDYTVVTIQLGEGR